MSISTQASTASTQALQSSHLLTPPRSTTSRPHPPWTLRLTELPPPPLILTTDHPTTPRPTLKLKPLRVRLRLRVRLVRVTALRLRLKLVPSTRPTQPTASSTSSTSSTGPTSSESVPTTRFTWPRSSRAFIVLSLSWLMAFAESTFSDRRGTRGDKLRGRIRRGRGKWMGKGNERIGQIGRRAY